MSECMGRCSQFLIGLLAMAILQGCVSTTSGPPQSEPDENEAADLLYQLGARYYRNGEYELAKERLLMSIEKDPDNPIAFTTLALTYEQLDNVRLATEAYEQAIKIAPKNYNVLNTYAVFLCRYGEYDEAQKHFERGINIRENDDPEIMLTNAGVCMVEKPDPAKAEQYFRLALDQKATYGDALIQMCLLKHRAGDDLLARAFMQRYLATNPASAEVLHLGMKIEIALGDKRAAEEYSNRILREFPQSPEARMVMDNFAQ